MEKSLTLKEVIALLCADIDIYLLKEEDQKTDKDKTYTVEEIRSQLFKSSRKLIDKLALYGVDVDRPV
ncbi:hypothetical protein [Bacteroides sp. 51]|uniref:hypothetical protein n=1 Tax=Bacteroides sp. 51 TaxID=2302938 RepID=UPI0013D78E1A|nr:hypothetical protein [Bacteroides sp. 51]NDV84507.1 hypothetical protein [Bacteroides sp. 51]